MLSCSHLRRDWIAAVCDTILAERGTASVHEQKGRSGSDQPAPPTHDASPPVYLTIIGHDNIGIVKKFHPNGRLNPPQYRAGVGQQEGQVQEGGCTTEAGVLRASAGSRCPRPVIMEPTGDLA